MRADFGDMLCSDCGEEERGQVFIKHWGPLVPSGDVGAFGPNCWAARMLLDSNGSPRPLGTPYEHRAHLMDDLELVKFGRDKLRKYDGNKEKLRKLLVRVKDARERFAGPRQMFDNAAELLDIELEIQAKLE